MRVTLFWHPYRYFPYEKELARREVQALFGPLRTGRSSEVLTVEPNDEWKSVAAKLTYFREAHGIDGSSVVPVQALLEASANGKPVRRQSTRYSAHGIHEYKGKFNPQIARVIGNILGLGKQDWILDPFCGSGTVLLEAAHNSWNAVGVDANPLSVEVARAKIAAMRVSPEKLIFHFDETCKQLESSIRSVSFDGAFSESDILRMGAMGWREHLPCPDYLSEWFSDSVLAQLSLILTTLNRLPGSVRQIFRTVLSDIIREVSFQDPGDLRIRRLPSPPPNCPAIPIYLEALKHRVGLIVKARRHLSPVATRQTALVGDARRLSQSFRALRTPRGRRFDGVITSPPYATALPYIDTHRLSLVLLGLTGAKELRATERRLIGNREITTGDRKQVESAIFHSNEKLPKKCLSMCRILLESVGTGDGFRRRNLPALVYMYLSDMSQVFGQLHRVLKPNAPAAIVIGPNATSLSGQHFVIDTPDLLAHIAEEQGFSIQESIPLNTYQRFDLHRANSIKKESLLIVRRR